MAHRGRLNVLTNVMGKPHRAVFHEFKGGSFKPDEVEGSGDVKYHLGASSDREFDGNKVHLSLTANPSHLEIVNPVVMGKARAKQDMLAKVWEGDIIPLKERVVDECDDPVMKVIQLVFRPRKNEAATETKPAG